MSDDNFGKGIEEFATGAGILGGGVVGSAVMAAAGAAAVPVVIAGGAGALMGVGIEHATDGMISDAVAEWIGETVSDVNVIKDFLIDKAEEFKNDLTHDDDGGGGTAVDDGDAVDAIDDGDRDDAYGNGCMTQ